MTDTDGLKEVNDAIKSARRECGGDGNGCAPYRQLAIAPERRWQKCAGCPMQAIAPLLDWEQTDD